MFSAKLLKEHLNEAFESHSHSIKKSSKRDCWSCQSFSSGFEFSIFGSILLFVRGERAPPLSSWACMICIECGEPVPSVYRLLSASKARLTRCEQCGSYADKYVEYEFVNLLLDLLLLSPQPYRHLIFNQLASSPRGIPVCAHLFSSFSFSILLSLISFLCLFPRINIGSYFYSSPYLMLVCVSLFLSFSLFLFLSLSLSLNSLLAFMFDSFVFFVCFFVVFIRSIISRISRVGSCGSSPVGKGADQGCAECSGVLRRVWLRDLAVGETASKGHGISGETACGLLEAGGGIDRIQLWQMFRDAHGHLGLPEGVLCGAGCLRVDQQRCGDRGHVSIGLSHGQYVRIVWDPF